MATLQTFGFGFELLFKDRASREMRKAWATLKAGAGAADTVEQRAALMSRGLRTAGIAAVGASVAISAALGISVKKAADFESSLIQMEILTGKTAEQLSGLKQKLLEASAPLPLSAQELAQAAIAAAKFGIEGEDAMIKVAKAAAAMAATTDFSVEEAVKAMAILSKQFRIPIAEADRMASVLARLDLISVGTAKQISEITARAAPLARSFGLSLPQMAGMAAALLNTGLRVEAAGTNLGKFLNLLSTHPAKLAKATGFTEKYIKSVQDIKDPTEKATKAQQILLKWATAAAKVPNSEWDKFAREFGINGVRVTSVSAGMREEMSRQLEGQTGLVDVLKLANKLWDEGTAAQDAYLKSIRSVNQGLAIAGGSVETAAITLGDELLPIVRKATGVVIDLSSAFIAMDPRWKKLIAFGGVAAAIILGIVGVAALAAASFAGMSLILGAAGITFLAIAVIAIKVIAVIALISAAIIVFSKLWESNFGSFRDIFLDAIEPLKGTVLSLFAELGRLVDVIRFAFSPLGEVKSEGEGLQTTFRLLFSFLAAGFKIAVLSIRTFIFILRLVVLAVEGIVLAIRGLVDWVHTVIEVFKQFDLGALGDLALEFIVGDPGAAAAQPTGHAANRIQAARDRGTAAGGMMVAANQPLSRADRISQLRGASGVGGPITEGNTIINIMQQRASSEALEKTLQKTRRDRGNRPTAGPA